MSISLSRDIPQNSAVEFGYFSPLDRIGIEANEICERCNINETAQHLIFDCIKNMKMRAKFKFFNKFNNLVALFKMVI